MIAVQSFTGGLFWSTFRENKQATSHHKRREDDLWKKKTAINWINDGGDRLFSMQHKPFALALA
jgi:hypothetical protein